MTRRNVATLRVRAKTVVLAGGALGTPQILLRTGLGDGVTGDNLRVHLASGCLAVFPKRLNDRLGAPQAFGVEKFSSEGMMLESFFGPPDLFAALAPGYGRAHNDLVAAYPNASVLIFFIAERSSHGTVRPGSGSETVMRYGLTEEDAERCLTAFSRVCELLYAAGAERVMIPLDRLYDTRSMQDARKVLNEHGSRENLRLNGFHPMGSARMGTDPKRSVVAESGEHHRVPGLFVADASLFPTALGVNPQVTIMAHARRIAQGILVRG